MLPLPLSKMLSTQLDQKLISPRYNHNGPDQYLQNCKFRGFLRFHIIPGLEMRPVRHKHLVGVAGSLFHCLDIRFVFRNQAPRPGGILTRPSSELV